MYRSDNALLPSRHQLPPGNDIATTYDPTANFVKVIGRGFWTMDYVAEHLSLFKGVLREARRRPRPSRTLVDLRLAAVQAQDVAAHIHDTIRDIYRLPEKAAIVAASNLARLQLRRGLNPATHEIFLAIDDAMLWLID